TSHRLNCERDFPKRGIRSIKNSSGKFRMCPCCCQVGKPRGALAACVFAFKRSSKSIFLVAQCKDASANCSNGRSCRGSRSRYHPEQKSILRITKAASG